MSIAEFSVKNSVLINMIMIIVFILGIFTIKDIPKEEMPAVDFGSFIILVMYPGVSPSEIEELIVREIEEEIYDVENIDFIESTASEGKALIFVNFEPGADTDQAWTDLNSEMDKVRDLPEDAEDPIMIRLNMREVNEMCDIALGGNFSGNAIREISDNLKEEILDIQYISKVQINGTREREIWIESNIDKLNEYGLSMNDIQRAINSRNMNVPGGTINFGKAEFIVRTVGEFDDTNQIEELIIKMSPDGKGTKIKEVAVVKDTLAERDIITKLDGEPSVNIKVYKKEEGNIISVMKEVRTLVEDFEKRIPGLDLSVRNDSSIEVGNSIRTLGNSALLGVLLVFIILYIFVGWRNALFAAWGIPFSFLLTFILMRYFDVTMNNLSLFALVLVLGMIVDDAIIVIENVHRNVEEGLCPEDAAIKGTREIMWPVIAAVATTVSAFLPMLIMEGMMGKFMRVFPIVVSLALLASLFESLIILPSHIAEFTPKNIKKKTAKSHGLLKTLVKRYRKAIKFALKHRVKFLSVVIFALILAFSALALRLVKFEFFPTQPPQTLLLKLKTPIGTNLETTEKIVTKIENHIGSIPEKDDIEAIVTSVGMMFENHRQNVETSNAQLSIDLVESNEMRYSHAEIKNSIREYLQNLPGLYSYKFDKITTGPPTGKDVEIRVKGDNLERLSYISNVIKNELKKIPGVSDIEDSFREGKKELKLKPKLEKIKMYGLSVAQIASLVRSASYGATISKYRGQGFDEYDIVLKAQSDQVDNLNELKNLKIRSRFGGLVRLKDIVDFRLESSLAEITHRDKKRTITIMANTTFYDDKGKKVKRTTDEVMRKLQGSQLSGEEGILSDFSKRFPGYQLEYGGVVEEQRKSYESLFRAFGIAILLIFSILAAQFRSYVQPFIVMLTIPFAFIGVIFGLLVTGLPFSLGTLVSVVALAGVVVNDSLVLVDFINKEREKGVDRWNSLINAGSIRLRPIILTTVTTIMGVMPMILSSSKAAADWKPMAVSIAFGLAFATIITLFIIPIIYSLVDSLFGKLGMTRFHEHISYDKAVCKKVEEK